MCSFNIQQVVDLHVFFAHFDSNWILSSSSIRRFAPIFLLIYACHLFLSFITIVEDGNRKRKHIYKINFRNMYRKTYIKTHKVIVPFNRFLPVNRLAHINAHNITSYTYTLVDLSVFIFVCYLLSVLTPFT